jgi:hypothetical protein
LSDLLTALQASLLANRKDAVGQQFWTEWRTGLVSVGGTAAQAGDVPLLGPSGTIDPSMLRIPTTLPIEINGVVATGGTIIQVNSALMGDAAIVPVTINGAQAGSNASGLLIKVGGTLVALQSVLNFIAGTNITIVADSNGGVAFSASGSVATAFDNISTGTNTTATLTVGTGASLTYSGVGTVNASKVGGIGVTVNTPAHMGQLLISQVGNTTAAWADPLVQGLYPEGSSVSIPPIFASPTTIQPVYIGAKGDTDGLLHGLQITNSGALVVVSEALALSANHFSVDTGPTFVSAPSTLRPILSIRPQSSATGITFFLLGLDIFATPAVSLWQLVKNGALVGASFSNAAGSNAQRDVSATTISGGTIVDSGYTMVSTRVVNYELTFAIISGVSDVFTIVVNGDLNGNPTNCSGALRWSER